MMKISKLLVLAVVLAVTLSKAGGKMSHALKAKHHNKKRVINMSKAGLHTPMRLRAKEVDVKTQIIKKTQSFLDEQKKNNEKADAAYAENPSGRSELKKIYLPENDLTMTGEVFGRVVQKGVEDDNMSVFAKHQYKLNDNMLYLMSVNDDYRNVQYGFNLLDVPMKSDRIDQAQCCARIESKVHEVEIELYNFKGYCFQIDLTHQNWLFCDTDVSPLIQLKDTLQQSIVKAWFRQNKPGQQAPTGITESQCATLPFTWGSASQSEWPCKCSKASSKAQSPIAMSSEDPMCQDVQDEYINLNFVPTYSITYGLMNREPEFHGNFGSWSFNSNDKSISYQVSHVIFKVGKEEHPIGDLVAENIVGEFHIHGTSEQGGHGVLAVPYVTGSYANPFISDMYPQKWKFSKSVQEGKSPLVCLNGRSHWNWRSTPQKFDLSDFFKYGKVKLDKSFFRYSGSLTKPPCTEQVEWYVMSNPAMIQTYQQSQLKTYLLAGADISPNNIRKPQPLHDRKYFFTTAAKCPELPPKKVEPPQLDYKYIKMSHTTKIPAMAGKDIDIDAIFQTQGEKSDANKIQLGDSLMLQNLPQKKSGDTPPEYTDETVKILIKKFLAGQHMLDTEQDSLNKSINKGESSIKETK